MAGGRITRPGRRRCALVILAITDDLAGCGELDFQRPGRQQMDVLVEAHDKAEVKRAVALGANLIGVNNRDLRTFVTDLSVTETLAEEVPTNITLVTESGVFSAADAARLERAGARAMLVGESLMRAADIETATRLLLGDADQSNLTG